jgi:hypothetical protein
MHHAATPDQPGKLAMPVLPRHPLIGSSSIQQGSQPRPDRAPRISLGRRTAPTAVRWVAVETCSERAWAVPVSSVWLEYVAVRAYNVKAVDVEVAGEHEDRNVRAPLADVTVQL